MVEKSTNMNKYTMIFSFSPDFKNVLLLQKSKDHKNPLFRNNWTAPGGLIEPGEFSDNAAIREFQEETCININSLRYVLTFACNCDRLEKEHEIFVYSCILNNFKDAQGKEEPIRIFSVSNLPDNLLWNTSSLIQLSIARLKQPLW